MLHAILPCLLELFPVIGAPGSPDDPFDRMTLTLPGVPIPMAPLMADFDGDGNLDLAVADGASNVPASTIALLLNDGHGNFTPTGAGLSGSSGIPRATLLVDLQQDQSPEIFVFFSDGTLDYYPNDPVSGFAQAVPHGPIVGPGGPSANVTPTAFDAADITGDGYPEVVITFSLLHYHRLLPQGVTVIRSDGTGVITNVANYTYSMGQIGDLELVDVTGDGVRDCVLVDTLLNLQVARGRGTGSFFPPYAVPLSGAGSVPDHLVAGDLDEDGDQDLIVAYADAPVLEILEQVSPGMFQARLMQLDVPSGGVKHLSARAMLGSGHLDILTLEVARNSTCGLLTIYEGDGSGSFQFTGTQDVGVQSLSPIIGLSSGAIGDCDGNATPDFVLAPARLTLAAPRSVGLLRNRASSPFMIRLEETGAAGHLGMPTIGASGPAVRGNRHFAVELGGGPPLAPFLLMFSPWTQVAFASPRVRMLVVPLAMKAGTLDANGRYRYRTPIHASPALHDQWAYGQGWILDPLASNMLGIAATRRLAVKVGTRF